jgi:D-sedoheptulose 7-phosphate isomerase
MKKTIKEELASRPKFYEDLSKQDAFIGQIQEAAELILGCYRKGGKLLIFGNGGSAAEAQHFSAELIGRFEKKRHALPAIALTTDTSTLTAQSNDEGFESVFSRQIEALGQKDDIALGITTSDVYGTHSANLLGGFRAAKKKRMKSIGLFSQKTKKLLSEVDASIIVPHTNTALIQEVQLMLIHLICRLVEKRIEH